MASRVDGILCIVNTKVVNDWPIRYIVVTLKLLVDFFFYLYNSLLLQTVSPPPTWPSPSMRQG